MPDQIMQILRSSLLLTKYDPALYYYLWYLFTELPKRSQADDMSDLMPWNVDLSDVE